MKKTYAEYLKEAEETIDFDALSQSWASKTLPNDDENLDWEKLSERYEKNLDAFMELISDEK